MEKQLTISQEEMLYKQKRQGKSEAKTTKEDTSRFDSSRKTAGAIYREAAENNTDEFVECGDLSRELTKSLVDDLNECITSDPFEGRPFYITIYEKKDLQMKRAILRRLYTSLYRPYPEDDTVVFFVDPRSNTVKFCWCLPHHTEMDNMLSNSGLYDFNMINDIRAWKSEDLDYFGFHKFHLPNGKFQLVSMSRNRDRDLSKR